MNTEMILIPGLLALAFTIFLSLGFGWVYRKAGQGKFKEGGVMRNLSTPEVRLDLTAFLQKQLVIGDADIRGGVVYAPVPAERLDPLAVVLENAASMISRLRNPGGSSLYVRDSVNERFMLLSDLDLDHLLDAARVMNRVAEDRRKSRSIYKGMTDNEMTAMTRAGLSQAFKDQGNFEMSNTVMSGDWDNHPEFQRALAVLDLTFKVKGARND